MSKHEERPGAYKVPPVEESFTFRIIESQDVQSSQPPHSFMLEYSVQTADS